MRKYIIILALLIVTINAISQNKNIASIKVTKSYSNPLDEIFLDLGTSYKVRFSYDWNSIHQIFYSASFINAPMDSVINVICKKFNLKYHFDDDILIVEKIKELEAFENNSEDFEYTDIKKYFGIPSQYNFSLSGKIKDENTGEALPYASIGISGSSTSTITNTDGYFTLLKVPSDTCTLTISYMGYKTRKMYMSPETAKTNLIIDLYPSNTMLSAIEIKGEKIELMRITNDVSTIKLSPQKVSTLPNIGEKDIMRSFQLLPGVSSSNETSSGLYVRGGTPDQNLILYDGFTVYQVDHLYGFFSAFNSNGIKDIQLYKGGYEAKFGGRLSSVTEITAKEGNQKSFNLGGDISLLSANLYTEFPMGSKITFFAAARKSYKGPLYNKIFKAFNTQGTETETSDNTDSHMPPGMETTVTSFFYDLNSKITYKPSAKDIISFSFYNGTDKLDNSRTMSTPSFMQDKGINLNSNTSDLTKYGNLGGALRWSRKWGEKIYGNSIISYSNYYSDRDRTSDMDFKGPGGDDQSAKTGTLENNDLKDYSFKSDYQWDIQQNNKVEFGGFSTYNDIKYSFSQNDTTTYLNRQDYGSISGLYAQDIIKIFKSKLTIIPGVRATYYNITEKLYYEPRFAANFSVNDKVRIKIATGKYYQFVNRVVREDIMTGSRDFWILSDGDKVPVGEAYHYIVGTSYDLKNYLFSIEAYYKELKGLTEYSIRFKPQMGSSGYSENFFNGTGTAKGIEFLAQKKNGKLNGWVSYTLGEAMNKFSVYADAAFPASQDVTHEFKIVTMYKWKRWDFSATWIYATGRPYTAPEGGYQLTLLDGTTSDYITVGSKNSLRLPDYHRMDLCANYNFFNSKNKAVGYLGLSLFNVYARKNVWYKEYTIVDGSVIETNINYLGFTPNITLSFKLK